MGDRLATALIAALAVALTAVALGLAAERHGAVDASGAGSASKPKLTTNKRGRAIIRFHGMAPGDSRKRRIRISNRGASAKFRLRAVGLRSPAGPNRGRLADALRITVRRIRGARTKKKGRLGRTVYRGPLDEMRSAKLGRLGRLRGRNYRFKLIFPEGGVPRGDFSGDNAYQGAHARVEFRWRAG
jgi:hypothetical protein